MDSTTSAAATERVQFCSRCGSHADPEAHERPAARVCARCGMGVYLSCAREALGTLGNFFFVVTEDLRVSAVSEGAESIFGAEEQLVGESVTAVVTTPMGEEALRRTVRRAAIGVREARALPIEAAVGDARSLGPLEARVSPCGPPRGALVAIEPALG